MKTRIAFIGFGEVAAALAPALEAKGAEVAAYDVLLDQPQGISRLQARAAGTRVVFCPLSKAVHGAAFVMSTVTTTVAREAATRCVPELASGQTYVDLNATAPPVKCEIDRIITPSGARFVEGALLGAVGVTGARTEILLGGAYAHQAETRLAGELGLNARFYSEQIGKASMFKMLRSVFSKGLEALLIEFLVAGERAGIRDDLWREVTDLMATHPFQKTANNWVCTHATAHARRHHEMTQVADVLQQLGVQPIMTAATEAFFGRSALLGLTERFAETPATMDEVVRYLEARTNPAGDARIHDWTMTETRR